MKEGGEGEEGRKRLQTQPWILKSRSPLPTHFNFLCSRRIFAQAKHRKISLLGISSLRNPTETFAKQASMAQESNAIHDNRESFSRIRRVARLNGATCNKLATQSTQSR